MNIEDTIISNSVRRGRQGLFRAILYRIFGYMLAIHITIIGLWCMFTDDFTVESIAGKAKATWFVWMLSVVILVIEIKRGGSSRQKILAGEDMIGLSQLRRKIWKEYGKV